MASILLGNEAIVNNLVTQRINGVLVADLGGGGSGGGNVPVIDVFPPTSQSIASTVSANTSRQIYTLANSANITATSASTTAAAASTLANSANTNANSASTLANSANTTANSASTLANSANTTANSALTAANLASTNANSANTASAAANTTANSALSAANTSSTTSASALTTANLANTNTNALASTLSLITAPASISGFGTVQLSDSYNLTTYPSGTAPSTQALKQLRIDATTLNNNFGTAASTGVTLGNNLQPLTLAGSSLTVPASFLENLEIGFQPTSIVTNRAATPNMVTSAANYTLSLMPQPTDLLPNTPPTSILVGFSYATPNSLTNAYNLLNSKIPPLIDLAANTNPTSTSTSSAATANSLTVAYNKLNGLIGSGSVSLVDVAANVVPSSTSITSASTANSLTNAYNTMLNSRILGGSSFGTTSTSGLTLGATAQPLNVNAQSLIFSVSLAQNISSTAFINSGGSGPSRVLGLPQVGVFALTSETGAVTVSTSPCTHWRIPFPWRILGVRASLYTPSTSGQVVIDIRSVPSGPVATTPSAGTSIFITNLLTIDANQSSSVGSATSATITSAANTGLVDNSGISVFIIGAGSGAAGCKLLVYYSIV